MRIPAIISKNKTAFAVVVLILLLGVLYTRGLPVGLRGDGKEYAMMAVAFQRHLSFGITTEDLELAKKDFHREARQLDSEYTIPSERMHQHGEAKYCNHYGSYSALVAIVKFATDLLGKYPIWAFFITNYLLYLIALLSILFLLKENGVKKLALVLLTAINPALFYMGWTHSEIYIYSFVVIGLVFYYNGQHRRSILSLSVAAMQNLAVIPFAMMVGLDYISGRGFARRRPSGYFDLPGFLTDAGFCAFCYVPAIIPIASTYVKFHTLNLVADVALENQYLLSKAMGYLFDLNMGILPYETIILLLFLVMVVFGLVKCPRKALVHLLGVCGMLYVIAHQRQINCGMQYVMRYNVWIIPVVIFFVIMNWERIWGGGKWLLPLSLAQAMATMSLLLYLEYGGGNFNYNSFAPWTRFVLEHWPTLYNPTHGIFYSRALNRETSSADRPVAYVSDKGFASKVLLNETSRKNLDSSEWSMFDEHGNPVAIDECPKVSVDHGGYWYLHPTNPLFLARHYTLGERIVFKTEGNNAGAYVHKGVSWAEGWGAWSDGKQVIITLEIGEQHPPILLADLLVRGIFHHPQRTTIYVFGQQVWKGVVLGEQNIVFPITPKTSGLVVIQISLPDATKPCDVVQSGDSRALGLQLVSLAIEAAKTEFPLLPDDGTVKFDNANYNAGQYTICGMSHAEEQGSWTSSASSLFSFSTHGESEHFSVRMKVARIIQASQDIMVRVNDKVVFNGTVTPKTHEIEFDVQREENGQYLLRLDTPNAISPRELGMSRDGRKLGLMLQSLTIGQR